MPVPVAGMVSDGQTSIRNAVEAALDGIPQQLRQFHYLREAATPVYEAAGVRRRYRGLIAAIARHRRAAGRLADEFSHYLKLTRNYWPGLFRCYEIDGLPRTNNDLEQFFGSYRYHERRCSGRKVACPRPVVRGSVRLVSAVATRMRTIEAPDLVPSDRQG